MLPLCPRRPLRRRKVDEYELLSAPRATAIRQRLPGCRQEGERETWTGGKRLTPYGLRGRLGVFLWQAATPNLLGRERLFIVKSVRSTKYEVLTSRRKANRGTGEKNRQG